MGVADEPASGHGNDSRKAAEFQEGSGIRRVGVAAASARIRAFFPPGPPSNVYRESGGHPLRPPGRKGSALPALSKGSFDTSCC